MALLLPFLDNQQVSQTITNQTHLKQLNPCTSSVRFPQNTSCTRKERSAGFPGLKSAWPAGDILGMQPVSAGIFMRLFDEMMKCIQSMSRCSSHEISFACHIGTLPAHLQCVLSGAHGLTWLGLACLSSQPVILPLECCAEGRAPRLDHARDEGGSTSRFGYGFSNTFVVESLELSQSQLPLGPASQPDAGVGLGGRCQAPDSILNLCRRACDGAPPRPGRRI